jgi:tape measure domain-containing protein
MANETIRARIEVLLKGMDQVESLKNAVRQLQTTASPAAADLQKLKNAATQLGGAADRTENDLRRSINALKDVRAQLSMTDAEYRKLTGTINKYQAQLDKATGAQQRGGKALQFAQTAGAVAASGVFGGPEGLIGAGIGAFFGGQAGALAGGAIGAEVAQLRQLIGATTTYASDVSRLNIALREIVKTQDQYAASQLAINRVVKDFNVPIAEATQGFTRLTASVLGAGGNVRDAEMVFRGVSAAVKATGGSAEDVQSSITAMSQVFGKGKVSAEELQGQLGERLPGAVTKFAEATGRSLPQLAKDLEQGTVGLNDLMKFVESLADEYEGAAKKMAKSTDEAGARMKTALDQLRLDFGNFFKPVGAGIQNLITKFAELVSAAFRAGTATRQFNQARMQALKEGNQKFNATGSILDVWFNPGYKEFVEKRTQELLKLKQAVAEPSKQQSTVFADPSGKDGADSAANKARKEAERLAAEQQRLNEATAKAEIDLQNAVFRNQMDLLRRRFDYEQERIRQQREIWAGTFEGIRGDAARSFVELQNRLGDLRKRLIESDLSVKAAQQELTSATRMEAVTSQGVGGGIATTGIIARTGNTGDSTGAHLDLRWGDGRPITKADADKYFLVNGKAPSSFGVTSPYGPRKLFGRSFHSGIDFGTPAGSAISLKGGATFGKNLGNTGAGGYAIEVMTPEGTMRALHLMAGSAMRTTGGRAGAGAQVRRDVRAEGNLGIASAGLDQARAMAGLDRAQVQGLEQLLPQQFAQQQTQGLRDQAKALEDTNALLAKRIQLETQGMRPELLDAQMRIAELELQRSDKLAQLNENLKVATEQQDPTLIAAVRSEIELTNAAYERQIIAINALAQAQTTAGVALSGRIGQLRQELEQLTNFENVIVSVSRVMETEISGAISSAVTGLVSGSQTIKQTLSQMFSNIGQAFVKMAADIIAKQLVMITLQTILKALGAAAGGGGGAVDLSGTRVTDMPVAQMPAGMAFANGGVMTGRGPIPLKKYARGGIANRPQLALYGEGSKPEAYVPLPDGRRIPVALQGQDKMREVMGAGPTQSGSSPVLNMSFQSTNIGGVEYVSRDQLEAAMAETRRAASRDGAKRGMTMTLDRLQQSPSTRNRVGLR